MNYPSRITKAWIIDNHNLNDERKLVPNLYLLTNLEDALDLEPNKEYTVDEFLTKINDIFNHNKIDVIKYSYGSEYQFYNNHDRLETNNEVIERLRVALVNQRKSESFERKERAEYERLKLIFGYEDTICSTCVLGKNYTGRCKRMPDYDSMCSLFTPLGE